MSSKLFRQQSKANGSLEFLVCLRGVHKLFIALKLVEGEFTRHLCVMYICNNVVMLLKKSLHYDQLRAVGSQLNFEVHCKYFRFLKYMLFYAQNQNGICNVLLFASAHYSI